jgi:hypothetical protein
LRNVDNNNTPTWARQLNPPKTPADWNEWWEHVFATVYWFNVRNDYRVDDWEVHNEPDNPPQGWVGGLDDYTEFVRRTKDAIDTVYSKYLLGRTYHVYAPGTTGGSSWPLGVMTGAGTYFDSVDIHNYDTDITNYTRQVHGWMKANGFADAPLWISEWGDWHENSYSNPAFANIVLAGNLIRGSSPGDDYVYGSHIFSLYDWGTYRSGLISNGVKLPGYFAMRLMIRGLQGCRPTFESESSYPYLLAITTRDSNGHLDFLATNLSPNARSLHIDLSALIMSGHGTMWEFDSTHPDVVVANPDLVGGQVTVAIPKMASLLIQF